eukprot:jgi/Chrzof1/14580/Cz09g08080.t1
MQIATQRSLFAEYEKREKQRKVNELLEMCPDLTEAAACRALQLCHDKEDEAAMRLTEEPSFKRKVMHETGSVPAVAVQRTVRAARTHSYDKTGGPYKRPKMISPSKVAGKVFVGKFRSKLGAYQASCRHMSMLV